MRAALGLAVVIAVAGAVGVGCGKRPAEPTDDAPPAPRQVAAVPTTKATTPATRPTVVTPPPQPAVRLAAPDQQWKGAVCEVKIIGASVFDDALFIPVIVSTDSPKERVGFRAWREPFGGARGATIADNNGTKYDMRGFDADIDGLIAPLLRERLKGDIGTGSGPVYANQPRVDVLLFDRPTQAAEYLDLDLDAANVGEKGTIRFRIPREAWAPKGKR